MKKGPLVVLSSGRLNGHRYREETSQPHGLPFFKGVQKLEKRKQKVYWMKNGASYHNTKANQAWRARKRFPMMEWPAQSPDLNPIENL